MFTTLPQTPQSARKENLTPLPFPNPYRNAENIKQLRRVVILLRISPNWIQKTAYEQTAAVRVSGNEYRDKISLSAIQYQRNNGKYKGGNGSFVNGFR